MSAAPGWEHFAHGADVGIRGFGPTREAAFEQAALALMQVIADVSHVEPRDAIEVVCEAPDDEMLLVDWLNALVFEVATRSMLFARFAVVIDGLRLHGTAWGEPIDLARDSMGVEVKGVTYTALEVAELEPGHWVAQCVVDV